MSKNHKPWVLPTPLTHQICENPINSLDLHFPSYLIKNIDNIDTATLSLIFLTFWGSWIERKDHIEVVASSLSSWTCYWHHRNQQITINQICLLDQINGRFSLIESSPTYKGRTCIPQKQWWDSDDTWTFICRYSVKHRCFHRPGRKYKRQFGVEWLVT